MKIMNGVAEKVYEDVLKVCSFMISTAAIVLGACAVEYNVFGSSKLAGTLPESLAKAFMDGKNYKQQK